MVRTSRYQVNGQTAYLEPEDKMDAEQIVFFLMIIVGIIGFGIIIAEIVYLNVIFKGTSGGFIFIAMVVIYTTVVVFHLEIFLALIYGVFGIRNRLNDISENFAKPQGKKRR